MTNMTNMTFSVSLWGSDPDAGNDDCWTQRNFDSYEDAMACFIYPGEFFDLGRDLTDAAYIELVRCEAIGNGSTEVTRLTKRQNPDFVPSSDDGHEWRSEFAMQAGMAFGVAGYNDAMRY